MALLRAFTGHGAILVTALPVTMHETLGSRIADLRPRWAIGTSRLVARMLAKHIDEFIERDLSLALGR